MSLAALTLTNRKAPTSFRIWAAGINQTSKGPVNFTPEAAKSVMSAYERAGLKLAIDFEHASSPIANPTLDVNDPPAMGGYLAVKLVSSKQGPELWADGVEWSDCGREFAEPGVVCCAKHQIESGQRRYFSPDFLVNTKTSEPATLNRIALCAEPATYGLALFSKQSLSKGNNVNDLDFLKALMAACAGATALQIPAIQDLLQSLSTQVPAMASDNGLDLSTPAPEASEAPASEAAPAQAAAPVAPEAPKVMAAPEAPKAEDPKCASKTMSASEIRTMIAEETEKAVLLFANKDALGDKAAFLSSKPLVDVKEFVALANRTASKTPDLKVRTPDTSETGTSKSYSAIDRHRAKKH